MRGSGTRRSSWRLVVAIAVAAAAMAACVATQPTPSAHGSGPQPTPVSTTEASASAPTPTRTPAAPPETPPATPTFGAAPSGDWKSLNWVSIDGSLAAGYPKIMPDVLATTADGTQVDEEGPNAFLGGVKGGYLQLLWDPYQRTWTPWLSADAQSWRQGPAFDLSAWARDFASWDKDETDENTRAACGVTIDDFAQAANGIVVRAHFECQSSCGANYVRVASGSCWKSRDGAGSFAPID